LVAVVSFFAFGHSAWLLLGVGAVVGVILAFLWGRNIWWRKFVCIFLVAGAVNATRDAPGYSTARYSFGRYVTDTQFLAVIIIVAYIVARLHDHSRLTGHKTSV